MGDLQFVQLVRTGQVLDQGLQQVFSQHGGVTSGEGGGYKEIAKEIGKEIGKEADKEIDKEIDKEADKEIGKETVL